MNETELLKTISGKINNEELEQLKELIFNNNHYNNPELIEMNKINDSGFPVAYEAYVQAKRLEGRSEGTIKLYSIYLEDMFKFLEKKPVDITSGDIRRYLSHLKESGRICDRTLDQHRIILNGFFNWCLTEGYIVKNPVASISPIKYEDKKREPFSDTEMEMLRFSCKNERDRAIIETLYATGCRASELARLKKSDINFQTREVNLFGKGQKHRISYLNARAEIALKKYFESRTDNNEYVFVSINRPYNKLSIDGIERAVKRIGERANVDNVYPHRFRHTFATDAIARGIPIQDLQKLLGHSKLDTTMIYAKVNQDNVAYNYKKNII